MIRSFRYRLAPTDAQKAVLEQWVEHTRELYNAALSAREAAWAKRKRLPRNQQQFELAQVRGVRPEFKEVPLVLLRGTLSRLDLAFSGFFRRIAAGAVPGYPRYRSKKRWSGLVFNDLAGKVPIAGGGRRLLVPLLGKIRLKQHRPLQGVPKRMSLTKDYTGRWFVTFACTEVPIKLLPTLCASVGVDVGISTFAATDNGRLFENPKFGKAAENKIAGEQRTLARRTPGSLSWKRAARRLSKSFATVASKRREHHILVAKELVRNYGKICVEDLDVQELADGMLAKHVRDAGWSSFLLWLRAKAEEAGREVVAVNPRYTSQVCSGCESLVKKKLSVRTHSCPVCGLVLDRDVNAARNILRLGRSLRRVIPGHKESHRPEKCGTYADIRVCDTKPNEDNTGSTKC